MTTSAAPAVNRLAAGTRRLVPGPLRRDPRDRWAAVFGRIAGYSFAVAVVSGIPLLSFFRPSMAAVVYHGSYRLLDGVTMSQAYRSVLAISFDVHGGLLLRQVHHWSANLFVAAIILRLLRVFFRGRFSGRALLDWLIWVTLLPIGMLAAYTGTILPDDGLSGGSLSVITGVLLSVPVVGTHLVSWIFGGAPPGHQIIGRDYWVHILVLPALAGALLLASFRPSPRRPRRARPDPLLPFTCATLVLLGTIAQVNPVWLIGPYHPGSISSGAVPDWYMGFLDGRLRIMPAWEVTVAGHPLALGVLAAGLVLPGLFFTGLALYPIVDRRITGERPPRGLLPPTPADPVNRTAAGVAGVTLYCLLWAAAANDQIAYHLQIPLYTVTWIFRVLVLAGPTLAFLLTRIIGHARADRRRDEERHGRETGRIVMNPQGGYTEIREPARREAPAGVAPPGIAPPGIAPPGIAPPGSAPPGSAPPARTAARQIH
ncbi:MAG TPA: cytochrome b N-terminal domain-containing protein [Streptosporangiaceae bacterium]|nr:cytochrome b N-terminal domain-containing protein [Streptosporangiaceae bacterium]